MIQHPEITSKVETITPEQAAVCLNSNTHNRPLNNPHVAKLADQMQRGLWKLNGDSIAWDVNGVLIDGQHRLWACVESGIPFETLVVRGLPLDAFNTKGTLQRARSNGDILAIQNEKDANRLAASLQWLTKLRRSQMEDPKARSVQELQETLELHPGLREFVRSAPRARWIPHALLSALCYAFSTVDPELVGRFMAGMKSGFEPKTPFHLLRERMIAERSGRGNKVGEMNQPYLAALVIRAWNAERAGRRLGTLRWQIGTEKFPYVENLVLR